MDTETPKIVKIPPPIIPPNAIAMSSMSPKGFSFFLRNKRFKIRHPYIEIVWFITIITDIT